MSEIKANELTVVDADFVDDFESPAILWLLIISSKPLKRLVHSSTSFNLVSSQEIWLI